VVGKGLAAVLGLPYLLFSGIVALPMWGIAEFLRNTIRDKAFRNTAIFGVKLAGNIIFGLTYTILAFCLLPWPFAVAFLLLTIPSLSYFFDYNEAVRRFISDIKVLSDKKMRSFFKNIVKKFSKV
jgi:hypothetical protein